MRWIKSIILALCAGYLLSRLSIWVEGQTVVALLSAPMFFVYFVALDEKYRQKKTKNRDRELRYFDLKGAGHVDG